LPPVPVRQPGRVPDRPRGPGGACLHGHAGRCTHPGGSRSPEGLQPARSPRHGLDETHQPSLRATGRRAAPGALVRGTMGHPSRPRTSR